MGAQAGLAGLSGHAIRPCSSVAPQLVQRWVKIQSFPYGQLLGAVLYSRHTPFLAFLTSCFAGGFPFSPSCSSGRFPFPLYRPSGSCSDTSNGSFDG